MSGKFSRDKGMRREREFVHRYMKLPGVFCHRIPLSGADKNYKGDLKILAGAHSWTGEVKCRSTGFKQLYEWLGKNDILHVQADNKEPLAVLPWWLWSCIVEKLAKEEFIDGDTITNKLVDGATA